jgi:hypothetical protein
MVEAVVTGPGESRRDDRPYLAVGAPTGANAEIIPAGSDFALGRQGPFGLAQTRRV